jgi:hypothetical protein
MSQKLAVHGGSKAVISPKIGWPNFDENTIKSVEAVLRSGKVNYWTGTKGQEFEKKFAEWQGSKYAVSVATGTAALHVSLALFHALPMLIVRIIALASYQPKSWSIQEPRPLCLCICMEMCAIWTK